MCWWQQYCAATDIMTRNNPLSDSQNQTLVSAGKTFQLGFFTPDGSSRKYRYVGIWYCVDPKTVVWVANRDRPLSDSIGVLEIAKDGNLELLDGSRNSYFSTNLESSGSQASRSSRTVRLSDDGNLVLLEDENRIWQSFVNQVTDTFIPGMSMDDNLKLTSWISRVDPAEGSFTFQQDQEGNNNRFSILKRSTPYWKSGESSRFAPSQMFDSAVYLLTRYNKYRNVSLLGNSSFQPLVPDIYNTTRLVMNYSGQIQYFSWDNTTTQWILHWSEPKDGCSVYDTCGKFAICGTSIETNNSRSCKCLPGFQPSSPDNWKSTDFSNGCTRESSICKNDTFLNLTMMKVGVPDSFSEAESEQNCRVECLATCQCQAYSVIARNDSNRQRGSRSPAKTENRSQTCFFWIMDLIDLRKGYASADGGHNLSVRVAVYDLGTDGPKQVEGPRRKRVSLPQKPVIIFAVGLDPKSTVRLFEKAQCLGEKQMGDEDCFVLKVAQTGRR
ncbi:hypothetical protein RJ639_002815 [Escallonia herrerae]|uniref:non-specific serine/threonine protein kinase n=1 Tax=Escallonia herrerae TaxID=1293975 RepID=A0AA89AXX0_9ASTE|nr:hypothetical protein RJ639_002815 [Escallonia herrerae]